MKYLIQGAALAAALTLAACGGGNSEANQTATENLATENAMTMDANAMGMNGMDANMTMDANAMVANGVAPDTNTANAMANDMKTNDPDTNLANGM